jgi:opacity protein-like surface antigen
MSDDRAMLAAVGAPVMERARLMRWVICAVATLALTPSAFAGDFSILRGSEPTYHWGGVYGGVQGGYTSANVNLAPAAGPDVGEILRVTTIEADEQISQWPVLSNRSPASASVGGFVGYNFEWESIILGAELNYNRVSLSASSDGSLTRSFTDSGNLPTGHHLFYTLNDSAHAALSMSDIAQFRFRAGWEASNFLPYAFAGFAVGRANVSSSATISYSAVDFPDSENPPLVPLYTAADPLTFGPQSQGNTQNNAFAYGVSMGFGTEIALTSNVFVRAELEHIYFAPVDGVQVSVSTARVGAGLKF